MIIYLNVSYEDRHKAKAAGALWNPARKQWYVENMTDLSPVLRWINKELTAPHKATAYEKGFNARRARPEAPKVNRRPKSRAAG